MKIALLCHFYPPSPCGGAGIYAATLANSLRAAGLEPCVLSAGTWDSGPLHFNGFVDEVHDGTPIRRLNVNWSKAPRPFDYLFDNPVLAHQIRVYLEEQQPDLVHVISPYTLSAQAICVPKALGIPTVVHLVDLWFICPRHTLLRKDVALCFGSQGAWDCQSCMLWGSKADRWSKRLLSEPGREKVFAELAKVDAVTRSPGLRGMLGDMGRRTEFVLDALAEADAVISPSRAVRDLHERNRFPGGKIRLIPYGIETEWALSVSRQPSAALRFGFLGNIVPLKGVHILIEAFRRLPKDHVAELHINGYEMTDPQYTQGLKASSPPGTIWHGEYRRRDLARLFSEIDVLVLPSLWHENCPLVIREAFAAGCPVVVSSTAGAAEGVQDEIDGLVFRVGDSEHLAVQLKRLVAETGLFRRLKENIAPVRTSAEELDDILEVYAEALRVPVSGMRRNLE